MELTAVEWLFSQLPDHLRLSRDGFDMLKQAKELEKQQIIDACAFGRYVHQDDRTEGEQYYNRKYGTNQTNPKVD